MKRTRSMRNAIKNNVPVIDSHLTLFTDSFNKNLFNAIDVQFNKHEFDLEKSQMFFLSKDLEVEKTKKHLREKGIGNERIEVIEDWYQMPISSKNFSADSITDFFASISLYKSKYKKHELTRMILLFNSIIKDIKATNKDLKDLPEYTYENLPESFVESNKFVKEWLEYRTLSTFTLVDYFHEINVILKRFCIDNKVKEKTYYLLKPKTVEEEIILATYIRRLDDYNHSYNGYTYDDWKKFDQKEKELKKIYKAFFVDFKDYAIYGYGVCAATERRNVRLNVFLTQAALSKGLYEEAELNSLVANAGLKYGEENTPLRQFVCYNEFIYRYEYLKKETHGKNKEEV